MAKLTTVFNHISMVLSLLFRTQNSQDTPHHLNPAGMFTTKKFPTFNLGNIVSTDQEQRQQFQNHPDRSYTLRLAWESPTGCLYLAIQFSF